MQKTTKGSYVVETPVEGIVIVVGKEERDGEPTGFWLAETMRRETFVLPGTGEVLPNGKLKTVSWCDHYDHAKTRKQAIQYVMESLVESQSTGG